MTDALMTIYRVEDAWGIGALGDVGLTDAMNQAMTGNSLGDWHGEFPTSYDCFGEQSPNLVCGVNNLRDLVRWFPRPIRKIVAASQYGLTVYRLPADAVLVAEGAMQVMFDPEHAVSKEQVPFGGAPAKDFSWLDS